MKRKLTHKNAGIVLLTAILIIQLISLIYLGSQKKGMHIDENYSYILSNSFDASKISHDEQAWNRWLSGDFFSKYLTVETGEQFSYGKVYYNNTQDAHPPLYYFLLHTVCSFFPEMFTPWFGMALNIGLALVTQILLFCLAKEITGSSLWGVVPVAFYGSMKAFVDTTLFIRMYALLTLFTVLLLFLHYRMIKGSWKNSTLFSCYIVTFLGVFTQYYFAFIAFFVALFSCIWLIYHREYKRLFVYSIGMLIAVLCVFVVYPAGITQITGSQTNNVGKEVWGNLFNFSGWITSLISMFKQAWNLIIVGILDHKRMVVGVVGSVLLLSHLFRGKSHDKAGIESEEKKDFIIVVTLFSVLIATVALISHVSGKFVNVRYIYNMFPVFALAVSLSVWLIAKPLKLNKNILAVGAIIVCLLGTADLVQNNRCSYLYITRTAKEQRIIEYCENRPLVMFNNGTTYQPTGLLKILLESDQVFLGDYNQITNMEDIFSDVDCSNGVVVIVLTDQQWSTGFDGTELMTEITEGCNQLNYYKGIGECSYSTVYLMLPESD